MDTRIHDKKLEKYSVETNDYVIEGELTVTITLAEYRELVSVGTLHSQKESEYQKKYWDITKVKEKLEKKLNKYICKYGELTNEDEEEY